MLLQQFINGITIGSTYALVAIGFTMIFGVLELTNFSNSWKRRTTRRIAETAPPLHPVTVIPNLLPRASANPVAQNQADRTDTKAVP